MITQLNLFHGTTESFDTFNRPSHGIYATPVREWASTHYGSKVVPLIAYNVEMYYDATEDEIEMFYNLDYPSISIFIQQLTEQGYNACSFGGESESLVLFGDIRITHAVTGKDM